MLHKGNKDHKIEQGNRDRAKRAKYSDCVKSGLPKTYSANNPPYKGTSAWKRICCNCGNNIRTADESGYITCHCKIDGHYICYTECMEGWCKRWCGQKDGLDSIVKMEDTDC